MAENNGSTNLNNRYDILQNDKGEILIMIQQCNGGPENPLFVYDGSQYALLYRSHESTVYFEDIAEEAAEVFREKMEEVFPDVDIEMQAGNQPIYYYIVSAE